MKKYEITRHAIEQAVNRFGKQRESARNELNQLMQTAVYQGNAGAGRIFDHYPTRTRFILADTKDIVITVYSMDSVKGEEDTLEASPVEKTTRVEGNEFLASFQATVKRELTKARRQFVRESRKLTEEIAVIGLEIAQLKLNKARARSPITQRQIADKVAQIHEEQTKLAEQRKQLEAQFRAMKSEVSGFVAGTGVDV